jgi:hypothetical protein
VEKVAQQVPDSIGQQDDLLPLLREMTETAAKREQGHQQQLDQIQEQWSESVKEIHRGHTMLQAATARRQDELSAQVLALVQAISTPTVSVEDMQQDVIHKVQEQLLRPAARAIDAKRPEENKVLVQTSGEQLQVDHRPSMSDLEAKGKEQESVRIKLKAFARVARKLHQKAAFHGPCKAAVYLQKAANFDWEASKSAPPAVWLYYGRYGTSHGSAAIKKPPPQIPEASKKAAMQKGEQLGLEAETEAQLSNSAADQNKVGTNPASAQEAQRWHHRPLALLQSQLRGARQK